VDVIERMPCTIKLLPVSKGSTRFYDFDEFERLVIFAVLWWCISTMDRF